MGSTILKHQETAGRRNLAIAATIAMLPGFTFGSLLAFLAMGLPQLQQPNKTGILLDIFQVSWLLTLSQPTRMVGTFVTGYLNERIGRKKSLILCSVCQILGCIFIFLSTSYLSLLLSLSLMGMSTGMALLPSYALLSEMSLIRLRSSLGSLNTLNANGGYLYGMLAAMVVPIEYLSLATILPSALFLALCYLMPESPVWLMRKGREGEARKVLEWLRGEGYNVEPEMKELEVVVMDEKMADKSSSRFSCFSDRTFLIPFFIMCTLFTVQAFSGCDLMSYYAITIFGGLGIQENVVALIFQVVITLGYVVSPFILSRLDCRPHFVIFILIIAASTLTMGLSILFPTLSFLSLPSLVLVGGVYGLGVGPVPFVLMSTLFPQKYKSIGLATSQIARALAVCLQLKAFPYLLSYLGMGGIFFITSVTSILGAVFAFLMIPTTRNKSIYELELVFQKKEDTNQKI